MDDAVLGINGTVAAEPCRRDTVEEIHAACDAFQNIARLADSEEVTRQLLRKFANRGGERAAHVFF